ncbi:Ig-like domain-containing protein [Flavobacterium daejeonense]|uniref:Ig-like domain-containing protein n=1 Tax=Flavobacterium daejeonense TaxID=350893 RepID=UPI00047C2C9C|nr:T9SS type B sorting domain-containing protein [Flavobacterium daejeonense]
MKNSFLHFIIVVLFFTNQSYSNNNTFLIDPPTTITAEGDAVYCPQSYVKIAQNVVITHDPSYTSTDAIYVQISSGYVNGQDLLELNNLFASTHPLITSYFNASEGKLKLFSPTGSLISYDDFVEAIEAVEFYNSSPSPSGTRSFSISIGIGNLSYLPRNGHYYEYVPALGIKWTEARDAAALRTYYGLQGYLATLTAKDEAQLAGAQAPGTGWIGGSDAETEGLWKWVTGPEAGTIFWRGKSNGTTTAPFNFANWHAPNEPNDSGNNEDYAHITSPAIGNPGTWNDLPLAGNPITTANGNYYPRGYIVEYGGMPGDPVLQLSASTTITMTKITSTTPASRCQSGSLSLQATSLKGVVNWYDSPTAGTLLDTGNSFTTPILSSTTTYYAQAADCSSSRVAVTATINDIPTLSVPKTTIPLCETGTVTLNAITDLGIVNWYDQPNGGSIIATGNQFNTPLIKQNTSYYAEANNNGCISTTREIINIIVHPLPVVNDEEVVLCQGSSSELDTGLSGMRYLWSTGENTQKITITTPGTYTVTVTNENNCSSTKTIIVTEHLLPEIDYIEVKEASVVIFPKQTHAYFEYAIDEGNFQTSNAFFDIPSGLHTAYIRDITACGQDSKEFIVLIPPKFFTPNNDSYNDRWEINGLIYYPKASVHIFDRYGKLISILHAQNLSWDGTYHQTMLPADDYWYVMKIDENSPEIRGHFSLKR